MLRPLQSPQVSTERLTLRPYDVSDAEDWFAIESVSEINHFMKWPNRDRRTSLKHLRDRTRHTELSQVDDFLALAVVLDGRVIGDVSLRLRAVGDENRNVEVAWIVHPDYSGRGYATEAASALLDLAFDDLGARWATAFIDPSNVRSIAVAERLGLRGIPLDDDTIAFLGSPAVRKAHAGRSARVARQQRRTTRELNRRSRRRG